MLKDFIDPEKIYAAVHYDTYLEVRKNLFDATDNLLNALLAQEDFPEFLNVLSEIEIIFGLIDELDKLYKIDENGKAVRYDKENKKAAVLQKKFEKFLK